MEFIFHPMPELLVYLHADWRRFVRDQLVQVVQREMAERPEDLNLPSAVVTRIVKEALPNNVSLQSINKINFLMLNVF